MDKLQQNIQNILLTGAWKQLS